LELRGDLNAPALEESQLQIIIISSSSGSSIIIISIISIIIIWPTRTKLQASDIEDKKLLTTVAVCVTR